MSRLIKDLRKYAIGVLLLCTPFAAHAFELVSIGAEAAYWLGQLGMKLITVLFVLLATMLYVGQFIYTQIMIKLGMLLMPMMVPFIMLEKTRFIFDGWVKFMVTAGFTKIAGAFLYGLMVGNINKAVDLAANASVGETNQVAFYVYSAVLLMTGITAFIMSQIQTIGNSLVSGFVSGGFRFSPMAQSNNAVGGAGQAARGAGRAANQGGGAMAGAASGAYKASAGGRLSAAMKGAMEGGKQGAIGMVLNKLAGGGNGGGSATTKTPTRTFVAGNPSRYK